VWNSPTPWVTGPEVLGKLRSYPVRTVPTTRFARVGGGGTYQAKGEDAPLPDPCLLSYVRRFGGWGVSSGRSGSRIRSYDPLVRDGVGVVPCEGDYPAPSKPSRYPQSSIALLHLKIPGHRGPTGFTSQRGRNRGASQRPCPIAREPRVPSHHRGGAIPVGAGVVPVVEGRSIRWDQRVRPGHDLVSLWWVRTVCPRIPPVPGRTTRLIAHERFRYVCSVTFNPIPRQRSITYSTKPSRASDPQIGASSLPVLVRRTQPAWKMLCSTCGNSITSSLS
jgi:hypothetical protein